MSGNGNDGTVYKVTQEKIGTVRRVKPKEFDGVDDWIESTNIVSEYNNLTFSAWFLVKSHTTEVGGIISKPRMSNGTEVARHSQNAIHIALSQPSLGINEIISSQFTQEFERWYYGTYTNNGSVIKLFINGLLDASLTLDLANCQVTSICLLERNCMQMEMNTDNALYRLHR